MVRVDVIVQVHVLYCIMGRFDWQCKSDVVYPILLDGSSCPFRGPPTA